MSMPVFGLDFIGAETRGSNTVFKYVTTGFAKTLTEIKSKIFTMLDLPFDIPNDITITEIKKGPLFKQYLVEISVPKERIGKLGNLISKKYGIIRSRPYKS